MVSPEESVPSFTDAYRYAESTFYRQFNDVDFYVEDADQENLYFSILKKLFPATRFENIFVLGGKEKTIAHAKANTSCRKSVYLVDKDFDDLLGKAQSLPNLFYLEKYCIENFLAEEVALVEFVVSEKPHLKRGFIQSEMKFRGAYDSTVKQLSNLFALFFIVQKHKLALKNTGHRPDFFCCSKGAANVDEKKVAEYARSIRKRATCQCIPLDLKAQLDQYSTAFELEKHSDLHGVNVSGEFILHLLAGHIGCKFSLSQVPEMKSFTYRLAEHCSLKSLRGLQERVKIYLKAP